MSHPRVYGENGGSAYLVLACYEPSPRVRGKPFLTRLNAWANREIHSLCMFSLTWGGLNIPV